MEIKSYKEGWNQAIDRAIEIVKEIVLEDCEEIINKLKKEFRQ